MGALSAWLSSASGTVAVAGNQSAPRPASPYLTYVRATGFLPLAPVTAAAHSDVALQDRVVRFVVTPGAPTVAISLIENGVETAYSHTNTGSQTPTELRDALLSLLGAADAAVAADGSDALTITGQFGYADETGGTATVIQNELLESRYAVGEFVVSVQAFVDHPSPDAGALPYDEHAMVLIEKVVDALDDPASFAALSALDVEPVSATAPIDITALTGTELQSRAVTSITFRAIRTTTRTSPRLVAADDPEIS